MKDFKIDMGKDFVWGVATAAYLIEGARNEDGKKDSIWDVFCERKGNIKDGSSGDVACDAYHHVEEDLDLIRGLNVNAYRFSIAWSRLIPDGVGEINRKGVDYYNRVINGLIERNITPYITLYHWDLPQALSVKGGLLNPDFPKWFEYYASVVVKLFGDRVNRFFTFNEPQCFIGLGFDTGTHAPGLKLGVRGQLQVLHHVLLAHGLAVRQLRKIPSCKVGFVSCLGVPMPASSDKTEYELVKKSFFDFDPENPLWSTSMYADPIFFGKYPDKYYRVYKDIMPNIGENDMEIISSPVDFFAQNTYEGGYLRAVKDENGNYTGKLEGVPFDVGAPVTPMDWHYTPECLYYVTKYMYERYNKPVFITENGISCRDFVYSDGKVHDPWRSEYIKTHLKQLERAKKEGVDVAGYFYWSLMDNFEWAAGYTQRFGLIHVDYKTQKRTVKDSYYTYRDIISK